ncbi:hypothetical protein ACQ4M4_22225 [Leptolyngbya sp. AN02str]|uniref:hypothetical protein n=1 Tax=Leptolyngbya sp. AN02str TaxID=3423363 RepID=UPI003D317334
MRHLINAGETYLELIAKLLAVIGIYNRSTSNAAELARIAEELSQLDKTYVKTCVDDLRNELANQGKN